MKFSVSIKHYLSMSRSEKIMLAKRCLPVVFEYCCEGWGMSVSYSKAGDETNVNPSVIRILAVHDSKNDWVAAESMDQAIKFYLECVAVGKDTPEIRDEYIENPTELTEDQMLKHTHFGDDDSPNEPAISFKAELKKNIADGIQFPCIFASSEF